MTGQRGEAQYWDAGGHLGTGRGAVGIRLCSTLHSEPQKVRGEGTCPVTWPIGGRASP